MQLQKQIVVLIGHQSDCKLDQRLLFSNDIHSPDLEDLSLNLLELSKSVDFNSSTIICSPQPVALSAAKLWADILNKRVNVLRSLSNDAHLKPSSKGDKTICSYPPHKYFESLTSHGLSHHNTNFELYFTDNDGSTSEMNGFIEETKRQARIPQSIAEALAFVNVKLRVLKKLEVVDEYNLPSVIFVFTQNDVVESISNRNQLELKGTTVRFVILNLEHTFNPYVVKRPWNYGEIDEDYPNKKDGTGEPQKKQVLSDASHSAVKHENPSSKSLEKPLKPMVESKAPIPNPSKPIEPNKPVKPPVVPLRIRPMAVPNKEVGASKDAFTLRKPIYELILKAGTENLKHQVEEQYKAEYDKYTAQLQELENITIKLNNEFVNLSKLPKRIEDAENYLRQGELSRQVKLESAALPESQLPVTPFPGLDVKEVESQSSIEEQSPQHEPAFDLPYEQTDELESLADFGEGTHLQPSEHSESHCQISIYSYSFDDGELCLDVINQTEATIKCKLYNKQMDHMSSLHILSVKQDVLIPVELTKEEINKCSNLEFWMIDEHNDRISNILDIELEEEPKSTSENIECRED